MFTPQVQFAASVGGAHPTAASIATIVSLGANQRIHLNGSVSRPWRTEGIARGAYAATLTTACRNPIHIYAWVNY